MCSPSDRRNAAAIRTSLRIVTAALTAIGLVGGALTAGAGTFLPKEFEQLVSEAEDIIVGAVVAANPRALPSGAIVTDLTIDVARTLKGPHVSTLSLQVLGGRLGDRTLELPGVPKLVPGQRYLIFVKGNGRSVFPVVGGRRGLFLVVSDPALGDVVRGARGEPIADVPVPLADFAAAVEQELRLR